MANMLLDELFQDIFSRLPIRSLMRCRRVCRSWRDLIRGPFFTRNQLSRSLASKAGLMFHTTVCYEELCFFSEFFFMDRRNESIIPTCLPMNFTIFNFNEFYVMGSCNGLLCLVSRFDRFVKFVCNPFLRQCIKLPSNEYPPGGVNYVTCEIGFCPKTQSYKVLEISKWTVEVGQRQTEGRLEMQVYRLGDDSWRRIECEVYPWQPRINAENPGSASLVNGVFHWVNQSSAAIITVFDLAEEVFEKMPGPDAGTGRFSTGVLRNCLTIMNNHINVDVWMMKQYGVKGSWEKCFVVMITEPRLSVELVRVLDYHEEDGQLLLLYNHQVLGTYNPKQMTFKRMNIDGKLGWFDVVLHYDTLVSPVDFSPQFQV